MTDDSDPISTPTRRSVLIGAGGALLGTGASGVGSAATQTQTQSETDAATEDTRIVGFFGGWNRPESDWQPEDIPYEDITHLTVTFLNVRSNGEVFSEYDGWERRLREISEYAPDDVTLQLSLGAGYSDNIADAIRDAESRQRVADSWVSMVERFGFDGVDLDWEYPGDWYSDGIHNGTLLLQAVRDRLDASDTADVLSVTTGSSTLVHEHWELDVIGDDLDYINVMCYDYVGPWNTTRVTGHNTPLATTKLDMMKWATQTPMDWDELTLGIPFYGRPFSGVPDGSDGDGFGRPYDSTGDLIRYERLVSEFIGDPAWEYHWDSDQRVPWLYNDAENRFITYNGPRSVRLKGIIASLYGGAMILGLAADTEDMRLLQSLKSGLSVDIAR